MTAPLYPTKDDVIARMSSGRFSKKQAKRIANMWLKERPVEKYGHQNDSPYLGWWVYVNSAGKILLMEDIRI